MPSDSPSQPSKKPIRLGKYEVIRHIATGGMGAVYHARDTELGREVALKILPPDLAAKPAMVVRFRREYAAASKMQHENIVALYELGELNQTLYFAMEFVDGIDLYEYVKQNGPLDPEEARQIVLQGARALRHAAEHGIVHRDIKPSNFLLTRKNGKLLVKLTDFGLAREISDRHHGWYD
ncbi:MAG: serine/threonine-protein kinase [Gemmataceae bacterium]